jgi:hypothetical protein
MYKPNVLAVCEGDHRPARTCRVAWCAPIAIVWHAVIAVGAASELLRNGMVAPESHG